MGSGIRATVRFAAPEGCPMARLSADEGAVVDQVSTSVALPGESGSVTEFLADADANDERCTPVFDYGSATVYRTTHDGEEDETPCPCECLGTHGCPVHRYDAADGDLTLVFHAADFEQLQAVMADLRARHPSVDVQRLLQPPLEGTPDEQVFVNRGKLTDRQFEVLRTAYERGYFERPKRANATTIAEELGISQSTFTEHLVTAQRKLLGDVLDPDA